MPSVAKAVEPGRVFLTEQLELITRWENGVGKVRHSHFPFWRLGIHSRGRRSERMKQTGRTVSRLCRTIGLLFSHLSFTRGVMREARV